MDSNPSILNTLATPILTKLNYQSCQPNHAKPYYDIRKLKSDLGQDLMLGSSHSEIFMDTNMQNVLKSEVLGLFEL